MQRSFKFTKLKLITGYILILLLGAIAIVFIYKQTIALTQKGNDEIVMQQKLFIISNTLTKLYESLFPKRGHRRILTRIWNW